MYFRTATIVTLLFFSTAFWPAAARAKAPASDNRPPNLIVILVDDRGETKDLAGARPEKTEQLDGRLSAWLSSVGAKLPKPDPNFKPASRGQ